ncbi:hypothetical protein BDW60DRAFT_208630 [Aspergillus nidulans var. acristatus]
MSITAPAEVTAAATLVQYWHVDVSIAVWITVFALFILVINFCGESEVIFSCLKIMLIVGLIIGGIVINAGGGPDGEYTGFRPVPRLMEGLALGYLTLGNEASTVFNWFVNITTVAGLIGWVVVEATYLRFFQGLKVQGFNRDGFDVFTKGNFTASGFLTVYLNIGIFAVLYIFFKVTLDSKLVPMSDIDFQSEFGAIEQEKTSGEYVVKSETGLGGRG